MQDGVSGTAEGRNTGLRVQAPDFRSGEVKEREEDEMESLAHLAAGSADNVRTSRHEMPIVRPKLSCRRWELLTSTSSPAAFRRCCSPGATVIGKMRERKRGESLAQATFQRKSLVKISNC